MRFQNILFYLLYCNVCMDSSSSFYVQTWCQVFSQSYPFSCSVQNPITLFLFALSPLIPSNCWLWNWIFLCLSSISWLEIHHRCQMAQYLIRLLAERHVAQLPAFDWGRVSLLSLFLVAFLSVFSGWYIEGFIVFPFLVVGHIWTWFSRCHESVLCKRDECLPWDAINSLGWSRERHTRVLILWDDKVSLVM